MSEPQQAPDSTTGDDFTFAEDVWCVAEQLLASGEVEQAVVCLESLLPQAAVRVTLSYDQEAATRLRLAELYWNCSPDGNRERIQAHLERVLAVTHSPLQRRQAAALMAQLLERNRCPRSAILFLSHGLELCEDGEENWWRSHFIRALERLKAVDLGADDDVEETMTRSDASFSLDAFGRLLTIVVKAMTANDRERASRASQELAQIAASYPAGDMKGLLTVYSLVCKVFVSDLSDDAIVRYQHLQELNQTQLPQRECEAELPFYWMSRDALLGVVSLLKAHYLLAYGDAKGSLVHSIKADQTIRKVVATTTGPTTQLMYQLKFALLEHVFAAYTTLHYPAYAVKSLYAIRGTCLPFLLDPAFGRRYQYLAAQYCLLTEHLPESTKHLGIVIEKSKGFSLLLPLYYVQLALLHYSSGPAGYDKVKIIVSIVGDLQSPYTRACERFLSCIMFYAFERIPEAIRSAQQCVEAAEKRPDLQPIALLALQVLVLCYKPANAAAARVASKANEHLAQAMASLAAMAVDSQDLSSRIALLRTRHSIYTVQEDRENATKCFEEAQKLARHRQMRLLDAAKKRNPAHHESAVRWIANRHRN